MNRIRLFSLLLVMSLIVIRANAQDTFQSDKLQKIWECTDGLLVPESALYDSVSGRIYVSNIAGAGWEKDGVGFISILNIKGEVQVLKWIEGLSAPKGMAIYKNSLFVADIDCVKEFDVSTQKLLHTYVHPKGFKLNDLAVSSDGVVYVSDSSNKCIFFIKGGEMSLFLESDDLVRLNGLFLEGNALICGVNDSLLISIDIPSKALKTLLTGITYADGIVKTKAGNFIISDFKGRVSLLNLQKGSELILDTRKAGINAADLGYIPNENILLVPTFNHNSLVAYKILK